MRLEQQRPLAAHLTEERSGAEICPIEYKQIHNAGQGSSPITMLPLPEHSFMRQASDCRIRGRDTS